MPGLEKDHIFIVEPENRHNNVKEGDRRNLDSSSGMLMKLVEDHNKAFVEIIRSQRDIVESLEDLQGVLLRIDKRQAATNPSWQPIPQTPASSSSAWNPLHDSMMQKTIIPAVDGWRGTLDTLLIFATLFSAIVTAFYVQSSSNLAPAATFETNQLLANLTDVVILLSGANISQLSLPGPVAFEPEASALRLNFYWSISLVLSISIASLAVASRSYLTLLTRSRHRQTYKKLTDIRGRWEKAKPQLGTMIDTLPQLLIISVLLFLVGLLDSMATDWLSTSPRSPLALAAVTIATIPLGAAGMIIIYTFIHGCIYSSSSPFQSTASRFVEVYGRRLAQMLHSIGAHTQPAQNAADAALRRPSGKRSADHHGMLQEELQTFYASVQTTHDDDSLDFAAAALSDALEAEVSLQRRRIPLGPVLSKHALQTLYFFLSSEASIRSNVTAASSILRIFGPNLSWELPFEHGVRADIVRSLKIAAERCSATTTGFSCSSLLWNSDFAKAMVCVVTDKIWSLPVSILETSSTMMLLLSDYSAIPIEDRALVREEFTSHALDVIEARLRLGMQPLAPKDNFDVDEEAWDLVCDEMLAPFAPALLSQKPLEQNMRGFMPFTLLNPHCSKPAVSILVRWFVRTMGIKFVTLAMNTTADEIEGALLKPQLERDIVDILGQLVTFKTSPDPEQDSWLLVLELSRLVTSVQNVSAPAHPGGLIPTEVWTFPYCSQKNDNLEHCDFLCYYRCSIIRLLDRARTLAIQLPFPDLETLDVTWEGLSQTLAAVSEDLLSYTASRDPGRSATTISHRNDVKACILQAFSPFFTPAPHP
ncbi:uncharacterized protein STEHIDRAFT_159444 [Stereum hirsutum FP-91666 SS1]|uniref:uncharacterized protein n=1 Tax=Stereum hirsutum (strain FP-91666) TaxID=721885 RepID=UPI0004449531|nr:uncharacterized protein STEHIDRAFT_159444 [Stereum hirsutum FP-91666 SS1]EIM83827.1 hypothetical protein STEHIDRAFT_159444 [Stereum hirsutum FP-91666 SS1]